MLLKLIDEGEAIHSVFYFDTEREFPEIKAHILDMQKFLTIQRIPFWRLRHWIGFDFLESRFGRPHGSGGWCAAAKRDCCNRYVRLIRKTHDVIECIGFTTDEKRRAEKIKKPWPVRFPLIEWGMSSEDTLRYCKDFLYDFSGIYGWMPSKRVSCYDCPKQSRADWAAIKERYPELVAGVIE